jgi:hypothetical protein
MKRWRTSNDERLKMRGNDHKDACLDYMRREYKHLKGLSERLDRGKSIRLWMFRNYPACGVRFCSEKPELLDMSSDRVLFDIGGEFIAGDPIHSMTVLFPKIALREAGRVRVEITDVSEELDKPAYVIVKAD